jgi:hypothetical protein
VAKRTAAASGPGAPFSRRHRQLSRPARRPRRPPRKESSCWTHAFLGCEVRKSDCPITGLAVEPSSSFVPRSTLPRRRTRIESHTPSMFQEITEGRCFLHSPVDSACRRGRIELEAERESFVCPSNPAFPPSPDLNLASEPVEHRFVGFSITA